MSIFRSFLRTYHSSKKSRGIGAATTAHGGAPKLSTLYPNRQTKQPIASEAKTYTFLSTRYAPNPQESAVKKIAMSSRMGAGNELSMCSFYLLLSVLGSGCM